MIYNHSTNITLSSSSSTNTSNTKHDTEPIQCSSSTYTTTTNNNSGIERMSPLSSKFSPGLFDVICARGKSAKNHIGNKYFRSIVQKSVQKYSQATTRIEKSIIVSDIINTIRRKSPNGGFVKQEHGQWYEVGDHLAREKVGQSFRDLLHGQYKSSTKAKRQRRQDIDSKMREDLSSVIQANEVVSKRMQQLTQTLQIQGPHTSDIYLTVLMTQANCELLESFKKDESLKKFAINNCS